MKRITTVLLGLAGLAFFAACNGEEGTDARLSVAPAEVTIPSTGGSADIVITCNTDWHITKPDWVLLSAATGNGNATVTVTASGTGAARTAALTITAGDQTATVTVNQVVLVLPAQATVSGALSNCLENEPVAATLTAVAAGATSYVWYKDGAAIADAVAATYTATASGTYTAAGVNADGEGAQSAPHVFVHYADCSTAPSFADELAGTWDVEEYWVQQQQAYNNDHQITIEKIDDTKVRILNLSNANVGSEPGDPELGDAIVATLDPVKRTITMEYQALTPAWNEEGDTYFAPIIDMDPCSNQGLSTTQTIVGANGNLSLVWDAPNEAPLNGAPVKMTYIYMFVQNGTCMGHFGYCLGTTWTKVN